MDVLEEENGELEKIDKNGSNSQRDENSAFLNSLISNPTLQMTFVFLLQEGDSHDFFKIQHKLEKAFALDTIADFSQPSIVNKARPKREKQHIV